PGDNTVDDRRDGLEQSIQIESLRRDAGNLQKKIEKLAALSEPNGWFYPRQPDAVPGHLYTPVASAPLDSTMATLALAPTRVAPPATIARRVSSVRTPPEAFTPIFGPTVARISAISATVAPDLLKPVEVLTKSVPAATHNRQAVRFCSSD